MDRLLMGGVRPNDIKMGTTDVNEVYCDGILVWKRESEFQKTYATGAPYLSASSTVKWTANDTSNEQVSYGYSYASTGYGSYEIDLSSIPSNATIIQATVSWYYGFSRPSNIPSSAYGGVESKIYFEGNDSNSTSIYGENSNKTLTCTTSIKPGTINKLILSYKQKGNRFSTANNGTSISKTCTCSLSKIRLSIQYKV